MYKTGESWGTNQEEIIFSLSFCLLYSSQHFPYVEGDRMPTHKYICLTSKRLDCPRRTEDSNASLSFSLGPPFWATATPDSVRRVLFNTAEECARAAKDYIAHHAVGNGSSFEAEAARATAAATQRHHVADTGIGVVGEGMNVDREKSSATKHYVELDQALASCGDDSATQDRAKEADTSIYTDTAGIKVFSEGVRVNGTRDHSEQSSAARQFTEKKYALTRNGQNSATGYRAGKAYTYTLNATKPDQLGAPLQQSAEGTHPRSPTWYEDDKLTDVGTKEASALIVEKSSKQARFHGANQRVPSAARTYIVQHAVRNGNFRVEPACVADRWHRVRNTWIRAVRDSTNVHSERASVTGLSSEREHALARDEGSDAAYHRAKETNTLMWEHRKKTKQVRFHDIFSVVSWDPEDPSPDVRVKFRYLNDGPNSVTSENDRVENEEYKNDENTHVNEYGYDDEKESEVEEEKEVIVISDSDDVEK